MKRIGAMAVALVMTGCAIQLTPQGQQVRVADTEAMLKDCKLLGKVTGGASSSAGMDAARVDARNKAAALGATDVIFMNEFTENFTAMIDGHAYRCATAPR
jgi:Domain of unknown function (DUF4156)